MTNGCTDASAWTRLPWSDTQIYKPWRVLTVDPPMSMWHGVAIITWMHHSGFIRIILMHGSGMIFLVLITESQDLSIRDYITYG